MNSKDLFRQYLRSARKSLPPKVRQKATKRINQQLKKYLKRGKKLAIYQAMGSEVKLDTIIQVALKRGMKVYEPQIIRRTKRMKFISHQQHTPTQRIEKMDIIFMPLLGADSQGRRLGQGGGYYDASLAHIRIRIPLLIGVGFACQYCERLPEELHDFPLHNFVCEQGIYRFNHSHYRKTS